MKWLNMGGGHHVSRKDYDVELLKRLIKNISKYQLNISAEELSQRFVRGDASRNTQGNGLGLSIAQSLMSLQGGELKLDINGDLFVATIYLEKKRDRLENECTKKDKI